MDLPHHLQVINSCNGRGQDATFDCFSMLPTELRVCVWTMSLKRHRLLEVEVDHLAASESERKRPGSKTNALHKLTSPQNYTATVQALQLNTKLLRVNRESRKTALEFYRVHLPCHLQASRDGGQTANPPESVLYFNPEYDFVFPSTRGHAAHTFVDFFHDLRAYDPHDVGLLNLALDINGMNAALNGLADISDVPGKASFVKSLSQLREIIWVAQSHSGRSIMGPYEDFAGVGVRFNHSMPIKAHTPSFDLLSRDPRPVGPELKYVLTGTIDPRQMRVCWQKLLKKWEIHPAQPPRERVLFTYDPPPYRQQVYDAETTVKFLHEEQDNWAEMQQFRHKMTLKLAGKVPVESPEELAKAVQPAVGFWLFPVEALGPLEGELWRSKKVFDMTSYWPELALSSIS